MPSVELSDTTYEKLAFAAKLFGVSIAEAVDRLVATPPAPTTSTVVSQSATEIKVSATYLGQHIGGYLDTASERLRITEAPAADLLRSYKSPSQAAVETVRRLNPTRKRPETNGWRFFSAEDGQLIERHRLR